MEEKMQGREYSLDFLKICATIIIVFHHYQQVFGVSFSRFNFVGGSFYFGYIVELFFVVSGYFTFSYIRRINDGLEFKNYFIHKALRLLPLVTVGAVVYEILLYIYSNVYGLNWFDQKASLWGAVLDCLGVQCGWSSQNPCVNNPTWYISVLMLCYIVFYAITYWSNRLKISPYYGYIFMIFVGMGIMTYGIARPFLNYDCARGYYSFFFGIILNGFLSCSRMGQRKTMIGFIILICITMLMVFQWEVVSNDINYICTFLYYPSIIIVLKTGIFTKIFRNRIWGKIGEISFDVYIWHVIIMLGVKILVDIFGVVLNYNSVITMLIFTLVSFVLGAFSHYLIEKPINKLIKKSLAEAEKQEI